MDARPLFNNVIIKRASVDDTVGSIVIPDAAKEKPQTGTVLAVGDECKEVKPGDVVLFSRYAGDEINLGEEEFLLLAEEDIQVVLGFDDTTDG